MLSYIFIYLSFLTFIFQTSDIFVITLSSVRSSLNYRLTGRWTLPVKITQQLYFFKLYISIQSPSFTSPLPQKKVSMTKLTRGLATCLYWDVKDHTSQRSLPWTTTFQTTNVSSSSKPDLFSNFHSLCRGWRGQNISMASRHVGFHNPSWLK